jgi:spoIIIJ-associated protein
MNEDVPLDQQAEVAREFLEGLVDAFGVHAQVTAGPVVDETVELAIQGDNLGLLIGPKGQTLTAIQELARTVVQRRTGGRNGRLLVDVAGYRQARREALARFTRQVADQVKESGQARALEPMHPADRKIVHDTVNEIDGVATTSEGEEPRRRVVIVPD